MDRISVFFVVVFAAMSSPSIALAKESGSNTDALPGSARAIQDSITRFFGIDASRQDFVLVEEDGPVKFLTIISDKFAQAIGLPSYAYLMPQVGYFRAEPESDGWAIRSTEATGYSNDLVLGGQDSVKTQIASMNVNAKLAYELLGESRLAAEFRDVNSATSANGDSDVDSFGTIYLWSRLNGISTSLSMLQGGITSSELQSEIWRSGQLSLMKTQSASINWKLKGDFSGIRKDIVSGYSLQRALNENLLDGVFSRVSEYEFSLRSKNIVNKPVLNLDFGIDDLSAVIRKGEEHGTGVFDFSLNDFHGLGHYFSAALGDLLPFDAKVHATFKVPLDRPERGKDSGYPVAFPRFSASIASTKYSVELEGAGDFTADTHKFNGTMNIRAKGLKAVIEKTVVPNFGKYRVFRDDQASVIALFAAGTTSGDVTTWTVRFHDGSPALQ